MFKVFNINKTGLNEDTINSIRSAVKNIAEISQVIIYGSRAKGSYRNGSDIDLCLIGNDLSTDTVLKLSQKLDELYSPYSFDISVYEKLDNPKFKDHIDRVGMVFYP